MDFLFPNFGGGGGGNSTAQYVLGSDDLTLTNGLVATAGPGIRITITGRLITFSASGAGTGTVTQVDVTMPAEFTAGGTHPITTSGTISFTKANQNANKAWLGPKTGAAAQPTFRSIFGQDIITAISASSHMTYDLVNDTLALSATGFVDGVTVGNLSPLFTTANSGTALTPSFTYSQVVQAATMVFAGPASGSAANPTFRELGATDVVQIFVPGPNMTITQQGSNTLLFSATGSSNTNGTVTSVAMDNLLTLYTTSNSGTAKDPHFSFAKTNPLAGTVLAGVPSGSANGWGFRQLGATDLIQAFVSGTGISIVQLDNNTIQITNTATGSSGVTNLLVDNIGTIINASVANSTTIPHISWTVNNQASGGFWRGPVSGASAPPTFDHIYGQDLQGTLVPGANVTISLVGNTLVFASTASGGGGGTVTQVTTHNLSPLFNSTVATNTTTPDIQYTIAQAASGYFIAGSVSGAAADLSARPITYLDLPIIAGSHITFTPAGNYVTIDTTGLQPTSTGLTNLLGVTPAGLLALTAANTYAARTIQGTAGKIQVSQGDGAAGNPTINVGSNVYTNETSSLINALSSGIAGLTGIVVQKSDTTFIDRTITGTANRIAVSNGDGQSGNPSIDVGSNVYTNNTSGLINALSSGLTGSTGLVVQKSDTSVVDRTILGTANRVVVSNGDGQAGNPTLDVGTSVFTVSTSNLLNAFASGTPTNGQIPIGNGSTYTPAVPTAGAGIQIVTGPGSLTISSFASGAVISSGNLNPWFSTSITAGTLSFSPTGTKGDIPYYSANNTAASLAIGQPTQVLGVTSSGLPGYLNLLQGFASAVISATLAASSAGYQAIDASQVAVVLTLEAASSAPGKIHWFKNITVTGTNAATVQTNGTDSIEGLFTAKVILKLQTMGLISDGVSVWRYLEPQIKSPSSGGLGSNTTPTDGQIPIGSTSGGTYSPAAPTAGAGIQIALGNSTLTISSFASGAVISSGNLSPLFTTSITNGALSFALSTMAASSFYGTGTGTTPQAMALLAGTNVTLAWTATGVTINSTGGGGGSSWTWSTFTTSATGAVNTKYEVDISGGSATFFMPGSASSTNIIGLFLKNVGSNPANTLTVQPYTGILNNPGTTNTSSMAFNRQGDYIELEFGSSGWIQTR